MDDTNNAKNSLSIFHCFHIYRQRKIWRTDRQPSLVGEAPQEEEEEEDIYRIWFMIRITCYKKALPQKECSRSSRNSKTKVCRDIAGRACGAQSSCGWWSRLIIASFTLAFVDSQVSSVNVAGTLQWGPAVVIYPTAEIKFGLCLLSLQNYQRAAVKPMGPVEVSVKRVYENEYLGESGENAYHSSSLITTPVVPVTSPTPPKLYYPDKSLVNTPS
ncbi:hypothetical protein RR46_04843 [Papilio xuthus]|uniref:Uncharacterized protein n=1 Tax=Papilio xuthus TaxID=66420 RepID=A0A194Q4D4_PAPXU|nr:hypothetical protein RR46_04843 [Papilio xuthus]